MARLAANACTGWTVNCKGANEKGKVGLEYAIAVYIMLNKGPETLIDEFVHNGGMEGRAVAGQRWVDECCKWWTRFSAMCVFAWQARWFTGGDLKRLREFSIAMGEAHSQLQAGKPLWSYLWIDHMYFLLASGQSSLNVHLLHSRGATGN